MNHSKIAEKDNRIAIGMPPAEMQGLNLLASQHYRRAFIKDHVGRSGLIIAQYVRPHIPVCNDLRVGQKVRIGSSVIEMVMGIQHILDRLVRYRRNLPNDIGYRRTCCPRS